MSVCAECGKNLKSHDASGLAYKPATLDGRVYGPKCWIKFLKKQHGSMMEVFHTSNLPVTEGLSDQELSQLRVQRASEITQKEVTQESVTLLGNIIGRKVEQEAADTRNYRRDIVFSHFSSGLPLAIAAGQRSLNPGEGVLLELGVRFDSNNTESHFKKTFLNFLTGGADDSSIVFNDIFEADMNYRYLLDLKAEDTYGKIFQETCELAVKKGILSEIAFGMLQEAYKNTSEGHLKFKNIDITKVPTLIDTVLTERSNTYAQSEEQIYSLLRTSGANSVSEIRSGNDFISLAAMKRLSRLVNGEPIHGDMDLGPAAFLALDVSGVLSQKTNDEPKGVVFVINEHGILEKITIVSGQPHAYAPLDVFNMINQLTIQSEKAASSKLSTSDIFSKKGQRYYVAGLGNNSSCSLVYKNEENTENALHTDNAIGTEERLSVGSKAAGSTMTNQLYSVSATEDEKIKMRIVATRVDETFDDGDWTDKHTMVNTPTAHSGKIVLAGSNEFDYSPTLSTTPSELRDTYLQRIAKSEGKSVRQVEDEFVTKVINDSQAGMLYRYTNGIEPSEVIDVAKVSQEDKYNLLIGSYGRSPVTAELFAKAVIVNEKNTKKATNLAKTFLDLAGDNICTIPQSFSATKYIKSSETLDKPATNTRTMVSLLNAKGEPIPQGAESLEDLEKSPRLFSTFPKIKEEE
jgi:hypothetical protein